MGKTSATFCQALNPWQGSVQWAATATTLFQKANELYNQYALVKGDIPRHVTMLQERVQCTERYVLADLIRLLQARDLRTPLYLDKLASLVCRAAELAVGCTSPDNGHKIEVTPAIVRDMGHVMAEIQSVFNEYGFSRAVDFIPEPEEAAKRLDVLLAKITQLEVRLTSTDPENMCVTLRSYGAQMEGVRQALAEDVFASLKDKFTPIGQAFDRVLELLVQGNCSSPHDSTVKNYVDAEKVLHKSFVRSIFSNADAVAAAVTSHTIQTGTRGWLLEAVQKWLESPPGPNSKTLFYLAAQSGTGKTAVASAVCKLFTRELAACHMFDRTKRGDFQNTANGLIQCLASSMLASVPAYLEHMNAKYGEVDLKSLLSKSWTDSYNLLIRDPIRQIYGNAPPAHRHVIVIDSLDESPRAEWAALKDFLVSFTSDLPPSFLLLVTAQTKNLPQFVSATHENVEGIRLDDRAWINRHIKDIELYIAGSIGAVLCGEDAAAATATDAPTRAKSDESTLQNVVDELLKCSAGRFDYALDLIGVFAREMAISSQFLSSLKKAMGQLRVNHELEFEDKMTEFANPYRAYRDKEGRTVNVRVLRQSQFLMDMSRAAIVRSGLKVLTTNGNNMLAHT